MRDSPDSDNRDERARLGISLTEAEELVGDTRGQYDEIPL
jgi:hypothetical protein